jgi:CheY-like chemotaxis protein
MPEPAKRKVLIVEDEVLIRMTTVDMLEELGHGFVEAGSGQEALQLLSQDDQIDVLLTDLGLPGMSGQDLIAEAMKRHPHLQVLVVSGRVPDSSIPGVASGRVRFLNKPYQMSQLGDALAQI